MIQKIKYITTIDLDKVSSEISKEISLWGKSEVHNNGYASRWFVENQSEACYPHINQFFLDQGVEEGDFVIMHSIW